MSSLKPLSFMNEFLICDKKGVKPSKPQFNSKLSERDRLGLLDDATSDVSKDINRSTISKQVAEKSYEYDFCDEINTSKLTTTNDVFQSAAFNSNKNNPDLNEWEEV